MPFTVAIQAGRPSCCLSVCQMPHSQIYWFKMVYLIGPDGLVNRRFANFHKMLWMTTVHPCCSLEICIPSVYRVCRIYQVLSHRAS